MARPKLSNRAKACLDQAERKWGYSAWRKLTPEMREAFVCRELIYMVLAQAPSSVEENSKVVLLALMSDMQQALREFGGE